MTRRTVIGAALLTPAAAFDDVKSTQTFRALLKSMEAVSAIDTHTHLRPNAEFAEEETERGRGINLAAIWNNSYVRRLVDLPRWQAGQTFTAWWGAAKPVFEQVRAASVYRYLLPAFQDLYKVDFDTLSGEQAARLDERIFSNYSTENRAKWIREVVTGHAHIELMLVDSYWGRLDLKSDYPFTVPVLNVTTLMGASHPSRNPQPADNPFAFAKQNGLPVATLDQYLAVVERLFQKAIEAGAVCLKTTSAYSRDLRFAKVSRERAAEAFGKEPATVPADQQRAFEDFMFWEICHLSAQYDLPFQIHTGDARIQGSNPILLVDAIEANPQTKFILFHGGYPWVGETGAIAMKHHNVWIDSNWLATLSYSMAKRAYQEWLEAVPSTRILWGSDSPTAETIYGSAVTLRRCLAEALAEKVVRGELRQQDAMRIGRQILRENALALFPRLQQKLWRKPGE